MPLVTAYRADNGQPVVIPSHWLSHPRHGRLFTKEPKLAQAAKRKASILKSDADSLTIPEEGTDNAIHTV